MHALTSSEVKSLLMERPHWKLESGKLVRHFQFADFAESLSFVNRIGALAQTHNHHPDIDIRYSRVTLGLTTHDAKGLTRRDADLAAALDAAFP